MERRKCPECGGKIYLDTDREWGTFGQMCCSACGWDDDKITTEDDRAATTNKARCSEL